MEELFRFSLSRPPDRTNAATLPLERSSAFQTGPPDPGPAGLEYIAVHSLNRWTDFERAALEYLLSKQTLSFIASLSQSAFVRSGDGFLMLLADSPQKEWVALTEELAKVYESEAEQQKLTALNVLLADVFLALLILRSSGPTHLHDIIRDRGVSPPDAELLLLSPTLDELAQYLRLVNLIIQALQNPSAVDKPNDIRTLLEIMLLLPPKIFASFEKPVHAVGVTELLVVKQHILRYELGEIARIENILSGESRDHAQKHSLSNERDRYFQTDKETQTEQELSATDHVSLRNEIENTLNEDTKVDAGLHAQYSGVVDIQTDLTVAYDRSSSETRKSANEIAKDVTQRAAKKVTERVQQSETTKIIETFEELEDQKFENKDGTNTSGVYQWVEKVYLAQVFNYGKRLLFDIMVPEPAASLLSADSVPLMRRPVPPDPLGTIRVYSAGPPHAGQPILDDDGNKQLDQPLRPDQLLEAPTEAPNFYGRWVARVQATAVEAPPPATKTVSKVYSYPFADDQMISASEVIPIDDGLAATGANVVMNWLTNDNAAYNVVTAGDTSKKCFVDVLLGNQGPVRGEDDTGRREGSHVENVQFRPPIEGTIPLSITAGNMNQLSVNISVLCQRTDTAMANWRLQTYEKIAAAWQKLQDDYAVKLETMKQQQEQAGVLGVSPPEINRQIERDELKRSCISILDNKSVVGYDEVADQAPSPFAGPRIQSHSFLDDGAWVRWFEQAFEWDKISYVFYPYFWGRSSEWLKRLQRKYESDPLFENFLKSGYARVVIPVRHGFRKAVNFYLATGRPWMGGDLPSVGDKTYLPITEEIKEQTGAPGNEKPVGEPWEIRLPTRLIKLRQDDKLPPDWEWLGHSNDVLVGPWSWKGDLGG